MSMVAQTDKWDRVRSEPWRPHLERLVGVEESTSEELSPPVDAWPELSDDDLAPVVLPAPEEPEAELAPVTDITGRSEFERPVSSD